MIESLVVGLTPLFAYVALKFLSLFKSKNKEIQIKNENGKISKYYLDENIKINDIIKIYESEIKIELYIENFLRKYENRNLKISHDKYFDFIMELENRRIAIEVKSDLNTFKPTWMNNYLKNNKIDEFILIVNSKTSQNIKSILSKEISNKNKIKFISEPNKSKISTRLEELFRNEYSLEPSL